MKQQTIQIQMAMFSRGSDLFRLKLMRYISSKDTYECFYMSDLKSKFKVSRKKIYNILNQLEKEELIFNLKHCNATEFNKHKPDAIMIHAYAEGNEIDDYTKIFTAAKLEFAPFGKWEKAEEGFAYNIPTSEFKYSIDFAAEYFPKSK